MTPPSATPADRAAAVLRAAEAAAAAGHAPDVRPPAAAPPAGAADRLLRAADDLADGVTEATRHLQALDGALARLTR